jgi:transposase-like protein
MRCPKYNSEEHVKNGIVRNKQRYKCKSWLQLYKIRPRHHLTRRLWHYTTFERYVYEQYCGVYERIRTNNNALCKMASEAFAPAPVVSKQVT